MASDNTIAFEIKNPLRTGGNDDFPLNGTQSSASGWEVGAYEVGPGSQSRTSQPLSSSSPFAPTPRLDAQGYLEPSSLGGVNAASAGNYYSQPGFASAAGYSTFFSAAGKSDYATATPSHSSTLKEDNPYSQPGLKSASGYFKTNNDSAGYYSEPAPSIRSGDDYSEPMAFALGSEGHYQTANDVKPPATTQSTSHVASPGGTPRVVLSADLRNNHESNL